jgi:hypothetical protein
MIAGTTIPNFSYYNISLNLILAGAEPGGFFMFPPGHPDYVPLPPGEAALIAGRQHIHAQERLAPHWSNVVFKSPTGAEIRAQVEPHSALKAP